MSEATQTNPAPAIFATRPLIIQPAELAGLLDALGLRGANRLSPLPMLAAAEPRQAERSPNELLAALPGFDRETARISLTPLIAPDRILDITAAMFGQPFDRLRLYASRQASHMVAVRRIDAARFELRFPLTSEHITGWLNNNLQFSGALVQPALFDVYTGRELSFLAALVDAYKTRLFQSHLARQAQPAPLELSAQSIHGAAAAGRYTPDRRWLVTTLNELFAALVHIGGGTQVGLPELDLAEVQAELARFQAAGYLLPGGANGAMYCSRALTQLAADLSQWICVLALHDLQITGGSAKQPAGVEEILLFVGTQTTVWTLVSAGLTAASHDLNRVAFGLRSQAPDGALDFAGRFLRPINRVQIPPEFYAESQPIFARPATAAPPVSPSMLADTQRFCRFCGHALTAQDQSASFCRYCGQRLQG